MTGEAAGGQGTSRWTTWVFFGVAAAVVIAVAVGSIGEGGGGASLGSVRPGSEAPDFGLESVRGGTYSLSGLLAEGQTVLLSFLHTQAEAGGATADPSRSQIVFLRSMDEQYEPLQVLIVDVSAMVDGEVPSESDLINFTYDWNLDDIAVLKDDRDRTVARAFGVSRAPTTFLIRPDGKVDQVWQGFASSPQLAFALQEVVGPPVYRTPSPGAPEPVNPCDAAASQSPFAGHGLARALSDEIWVVDAGRTWASGEGVTIPLTWAILGMEGDVHLTVTLTDPETGESEQLVDADVSPIPEDEAAAMLVSMPDVEPLVHLHYAQVSMMLHGCLQVEAVVTGEGDEVILEGEATIAVNPPRIRGPGQ